MKQRIISGAVLTLLAAFALFSGGVILAVFTLLLSLAAFGELCRAGGVRREADGGRANALERAGQIVILLYYVPFLLGRELDGALLPMCVVLGLTLLLAVYVFAFPRFHASQVMAAGFCLIYGPVMLSFICRIRALPQGVYAVWMIPICSWVCDTCAYFTGVTLGRHKLAPVLSPGKSVEGAVGGVAGSAAAAALYAFFLERAGLIGAGTIGLLALTGAAGAVVSQIGDLAASGIKRDHQVKDYGRLIPGHGGVMDRFDSVIFTAPALFGLLLLFF